MENLGFSMVGQVEKGHGWLFPHTASYSRVFLAATRHYNSGSFPLKISPSFYR
jgi:hypothetical protein